MGWACLSRILKGVNKSWYLTIIIMKPIKGCLGKKGGGFENWVHEKLTSMLAGMLIKMCLGFWMFRLVLGALALLKD